MATSPAVLPEKKALIDTAPKREPKREPWDRLDVLMKRLLSVKCRRELFAQHLDRGIGPGSVARRIWGRDELLAIAETLSEKHAMAIARSEELSREEKQALADLSALDALTLSYFASIMDSLDNSAHRVLEAMPYGLDDYHEDKEHVHRAQIMGWLLRLFLDHGTASQLRQLKASVESFYYSGEGSELVIRRGTGKVLESWVHHDRPTLRAS